MVSEGSQEDREKSTFSSYSCITSAAMISLSLINIWKALVKVDTFEADFGQGGGAESHRWTRT